MSSNQATQSRFKFNPGIWGLVVFWAFVESFLGGVLHALQVPLRGIVIAGAAVACLITIAAVSGGNLSKSSRFFSRDLIKATLAVMAVKLMLSPQAPPTAYVAMLFQGFAAYLLFGLIPSFRIAALLFSLVALLETALQKVLVLYLFFGSDFWNTFSGWLQELQLQFAFLSIGLPAIVSAYLFLYLVAGLGIGYWFGQWPKRALESKDELVRLYSNYTVANLEATSTRKMAQKNTWAYGVLVLLIIGWVIMPASLVLITIIRVLVIGLLIYLATPLLHAFLTKVLANRIGDSVTVQIIDSIAAQKSYFYFCWEHFKERSVVPRLLLSFESSLILSAAISKPLTVTNSI